MDHPTVLQMCLNIVLATRKSNVDASLPPRHLPGRRRYRRGREARTTWLGLRGLCGSQMERWPRLDTSFLLLPLFILIATKARFSPRCQPPEGAADLLLRPRPQLSSAT